MLPRFYKFIVVNNSGQTLTFDSNGRLNLKMWAWIITPATGKIAYTQITDDDMNFITTNSLTDGSEQEGDEIDNTSNLFVGLQVQLEVTHDEGTLADGNFDLYISAGDATGELESDASGYDDVETNGLRLIVPLVWHSSGVDDEAMRSRKVEVA